MATAEAHLVVALEQHAPMDAVELAAAADQHGFSGVVVADRFQPWLPTQGQASFAWTVLGAMGVRTRGGLTVSAVPGYRMHPAALAQASATLAALYPGRHRLVLSAGDAIDEHVVGGYWAENQERAERMFEAAELIRRLFHASARNSDTRHTGTHFRLESSRLWTMPPQPPTLQMWAGGPVTARRAGRAGAGIVVHAASAERLVALRDAQEQGAREAGVASGPKVVHAQLSWAGTPEQAMEQARRDWPMVGMRFPRGDIRSPFDVDQLARSVGTDDIRARIPVTDDPERIRVHLQSFFDLGYDAVHVHNVGRDQREWLRIAGREILPKLVS